MSLTIDGAVAQHQELQSAKTVGKKDVALQKKASAQQEAVVGTLLEGVKDTTRILEGKGAHLSTKA